MSWSKNFTRPECGPELAALIQTFLQVRFVIHIIIGDFQDCDERLTQIPSTENMTHKAHTCHHRHSTEYVKSGFGGCPVSTFKR